MNLSDISESFDQFCDAAIGLVRKSHDKNAMRIAALETKLGGLCMFLADNNLPPGKSFADITGAHQRLLALEKRVADLQGLLDAGTAAREQLEHRVERHAEHLRRLEARMKKAEGK